jgi:hypothetical protein
MGRRVRDWRDQDRDKILRRGLRGITVTVHFIRDDVGSFVIQRIEKCTITVIPAPWR